jgi:hypothetical protein
MCIQRLILALAAGILVVLTTGLNAPTQAMPRKSVIYTANSHTCRQAIHHTERAIRLPTGIMQANLKYHPEAFDSLEDAFDPAINARYSAGLFAKLRKANKSIIWAAALYQESRKAVESGTPPVLCRGTREEARRLTGRAGTAQGGIARQKSGRPEGPPEGAPTGTDTLVGRRALSAAGTPRFVPARTVRFAQDCSGRESNVRRHRQCAFAGHRPELAATAPPRRAMDSEIHRIVNR